MIDDRTSNFFQRMKAIQAFARAFPSSTANQ